MHVRSATRKSQISSGASATLPSAYTKSARANTIFLYALQLLHHSSTHSICDANFCQRFRRMNSRFRRSPGISLLSIRSASIPSHFTSLADFYRKIGSSLLFPPCCLCFNTRADYVYTSSHSRTISLERIFIKIGMIDNWEAVRQAHDADDLCFGTVKSWIAFVSMILMVSMCPPLIWIT